MFEVTIHRNFKEDKTYKYTSITAIRTQVCKKLAAERGKVEVDQRQLMPMLNYLHAPYRIIKLIKK